MPQEKTTYWIGFDMSDNPHVFNPEDTMLTPTQIGEMKCLTRYRMTQKESNSLQWLSAQELSSWISKRLHDLC